MEAHLRNIEILLRRCEMPVILKIVPGRKTNMRDVQWIAFLQRECTFANSPVKK
jgi:hypothetical protein